MGCICFILPVDPMGNIIAIVRVKIDFNGIFELSLKATL